MRATELTGRESSLWAARAVVLSAGAAAMVWQWAFWSFVGIYVLGFIAFSQQRRFIFRRTRRPYRSPGELALDNVYELWLNTPDGEQLLSWQVKPQPGMPVILYIHGQYCNLSNRAERVNRFTRDGYGLLMLSLRGFGLSSGRPSEKNAVADALLAYHFLRKSGYAAADIIVYGESLGSGVAVQVAARRPIAALVLEAPYTTMRDLVRYRFRFVPAYAFVKDEFNSMRHIENVTAPLLVVHSLGDDVIPIAFGHWLYNAAPGEKKFLRVRGAGHYGLFRAGAWPKIRDFLEAFVPGAAVYGQRAREMVEAKREATRLRTERQGAGQTQASQKRAAN